MTSEDQQPHSSRDESQRSVESDSSEDEVPSRNTVGDIPLEWYRDEQHIGYDIAGRKIRKKERQDKLDCLLASADESKNWRKIHDEYNDEDVELTKAETKIISRLLDGKAPHANFNPYAPYIDWFKWDDAIHPLSSAPEPKSSFIPSKWEAQKVVKYVRAIRKGSIIKSEKPTRQLKYFHLWSDDTEDRIKHLSYIPPPRIHLPGHEESYNPPPEYLPTQEEIDSYALMDEDERPKFIPKSCLFIRRIPAYDNSVKDIFERCLDLYLCPRVHKKRIQIDPEILKPKLPSKNDLKPYPNSCHLVYKGHKGVVTSISVDSSGQWLASGSQDGSVRIWEIETSRCIKIWKMQDDVQHVAWNPRPDRPILAVCVRRDLCLFDTEMGDTEARQNVTDLLDGASKDIPDLASSLNWLKNERNGGLKICHSSVVKSVEWHHRGDYFCTTMLTEKSRSILIHQLSSKVTQKLPFKIRDLPVSSAFHPSRSIFFTATKMSIRVFDLLKKERIKKLNTGLREVSSIAIHPEGDNIIVGSKEGKVCWFDMDLSSKPYKIMKCHSKDVNKVAFHPSFPLFASCSDDCTARIFHGMVYSDLNENPLIVPLEILHGHTSCKGNGIMDCKFHPKQPWLFTAGADSLIRLYCNSNHLKSANDISYNTVTAA